MLQIALGHSHFDKIFDRSSDPRVVIEYKAFERRPERTVGTEQSDFSFKLTSYVSRDRNGRLVARFQVLLCASAAEVDDCQRSPTSMYVAG